MVAGREWTFRDRRRLTAAIITGSPVSLSQIERAFRRGEVPAGRAYALSERLVREVVLREGDHVPSAILERISRGASFEEAFLGSTGKPLPLALDDFWRRQTLWNRWVPFLTSSLALWTGITLLALAAIRRRRARDAEIRRLWEEEALLRELEEPPKTIH